MIHSALQFPLPLTTTPTLITIQSQSTDPQPFVPYVPLPLPSSAYEKTAATPTSPLTLRSCFYVFFIDEEMFL